MRTEEGTLAVNISVENSTQQKKPKCAIQLLYTFVSFAVSSFLVKNYELSTCIRCPTWPFIKCCDMEQDDGSVTYLSCNGPIVLHFKTIHCHDNAPVMDWCFWTGINWPVTLTTPMLCVFVHFHKFSHKHPRFFNCHITLSYGWPRSWNFQIHVVAPPSGLLSDLAECKIAGSSASHHASRLACTQSVSKHAWRTDWTLTNSLMTDQPRHSGQK